MDNDTSAHPPDLTKYLLPEEAPFFTDSFRGYYLTKRYNFIASLNNYPDISFLYFQADENWIQALRSLERVQNHDWIVPIQLTIFCFRELRLAAELLFSCCTTPGYNHLRSAIEAFAQAQKILRAPELATVWLRRDEALAEYNKYFKEKMKDNLFPESSGFANLHSIWKMLCDAGPHPNITSLGVSSSTTTTDLDFLWRLEFFEVDQGEITKNLVLVIMCQLEMFKHTFSRFHEQLDTHPLLLAALKSHLARFEVVKSKYLSVGEI